ncbi:MAG: SRPBCC domain-containing protein [Chloroflexi bacterium]|nr:SRPBCC domain-containing protein [Chloroflexota bacterium]
MTKPFDHCIKQRTFIAVPPEDVFDTITSAGGWDAFFTTGMELDPTPGGKITWRWKDWGPDFYNDSAPGKVVEIDRPKRLVFEWGKNPSTISFDLKAEFGGTVVTLKESGYQDTPEDRDAILECACGWGEALTLLKFYLEHGVVYTPPEKG